MVKTQKEEKIKRAVEDRETFRRILLNCPDITAETTMAQVESLLGGNPIWDKVDPNERTDEISGYLQKIQQADREVRIYEREMIDRERKNYSNNRVNNLKHSCKN